MTLAEKRLDTLAELGWKMEETAGRYQICGERCRWISGKISGVEWSAWMSETSGTVYLHTAAAGHDFKFDAFVEIVRDGWPVAKVAPKSRGFDFGEDDDV
jgi:hypothetical protein